MMSLAFCQTPPEKGRLKFIKAIQLTIPEPSGLTFAHGCLYTVSDDKKKVYKISLEGQVLEEYKIGVSGFEGITYNATTDIFYLVNEEERKLYEFSLSEGVVNTEKIIGAQKGGSNKGLEGVCFNSKNNRLYLVNEYKPKELLKLSKKNKNISEAYGLKFGDDISGICYDKKRNVFWILSDESQSVYQTSVQGEKLKKFKIPVVKPEGVVLDEKCEKLYIVSDDSSELFVFQL